MSERHTPGPWNIGTGWIYAGPVTNARIICEFKEHPGNDGNARLIAAAPDLLAALEGVLRVADRKTNEFDAARAAIAKARS